MLDGSSLEVKLISDADFVCFYVSSVKMGHEVYKIPILLRSRSLSGQSHRSGSRWREDSESPPQVPAVAVTGKACMRIKGKDRPGKISRCLKAVLPWQGQIQLTPLAAIRVLSGMRVHLNIRSWYSGFFGLKNGEQSSHKSFEWSKSRSVLKFMDNGLA